MRVSAWEALCAGDPRSVARTKKAYYGFSRDISPTLAKLYELKTALKLLYAVGVVTTRLSAVGAYLRVMRAVRAAYERVPQNFSQHYLQQNETLVTSSVLKSDITPGLRPGALFRADRWAQVLLKRQRRSMEGGEVCTMFCLCCFEPRTALAWFSGD